MVRMSNTTTMSFKIDKALKAKAQQTAKEMGVPLTTLINSYLRQVTTTRRVELYAPEPMTPKLEKLIASIEADIAAGDVSEPFTDVEDFLADLKK
jgi:addiction module RelB/DinJ family antitoxin